MQCPFCKEEIQDGAIKCKHCQSMLNGSSDAKSLIDQVLPFGKWLLTGIFALSILAFFFMNFSITVPIFGKIGASMYDVVKISYSSNDQQSSVSGDMTEKKPNIKDITNNMYEGTKKEGKSMLPFILIGLGVLGLMLHYILTIVWGICNLLLRRTSRSLNIAWLALAVQFPVLFSVGGQIIISDLKTEMLKEGGADNPFAALGAAMVSSFSIEPGVIMWILMVVGVIGLVFQFIGKERVSTEVQSPMQKKIILAIISVIALLVLIIVLLNTTFKDKKIYVSTNDKENYAATVNTDCKNAYTASVAFTVDHPEAREITLDNIKNSGYIQTAGVTTKVYNLDGTSGTITCSGQTDWGVGAAVITINNGVMTLTPSKIGGPPAPVPAPKAAPSVGVMSPEEWLNKAVALFSDGKCTDPNKAFEYINEAIRLNPDYAEAYYFRGAVYDTLGDYNQSIANYNKAIELNSQFPTFYNNLGFAYQKLGNTEEAVKNLKIAASQGVKNAQDYLNSEGISW